MFIFYKSFEGGEQMVEFGFILNPFSLQSDDCFFQDGYTSGFYGLKERSRWIDKQGTELQCRSIWGQYSEGSFPIVRATAAHVMGLERLSEILYHCVVFGQLRSGDQHLEFGNVFFD